MLTKEMMNTFDWKDLHGKTVQMIHGVDTSYEGDYTIEILYAIDNKTNHMYVLGTRETRNECKS